MTIASNGLSAAGIALAAGLTFNTAGLADPPIRRELLGLREAPNIPPFALSRYLPGHAARGRAAEPPSEGCDKGVNFADQNFDAPVVGFQDNVICSSSDIDIYEDINNLGSFYVVQAGGPEAAWIQTNATDPRAPGPSFQFNWQGKTGENTTTPDVKAFKQGNTNYIALTLERLAVNAFCGVAIVNVTNPANSNLESQFVGSDWCDVHNVFVEDDVNGDGAYIYVAADNTFDLRVLDISNCGTVTNPVEVGQYRRSGTIGINPDGDRFRGRDPDGLYDDILVHDVTVVRTNPGIPASAKVYVSYWEAGLDIFDASSLRNPSDVCPATFRQVSEADVANFINIDPPEFVAGTPFLMHHAFPADSDGPNVNGFALDRVVVQDEITFDEDSNGNLFDLSLTDIEPVQFWDTGSLGCTGGSLPATPCKLDGILLDDESDSGDVPVNPAHNIEVDFDVQPGRVYVGWYKIGLQSWDFDGSGFTRLTNSSPRTADAYHQAQTEPDDDPYSGAWGIRLAEIDPDGAGGEFGSAIYAFQSDRNFGLIINCLGNGQGGLEQCPAAVPAPEPPPEPCFPPNAPQCNP